jgi:hypothetical protein
MRYGQFIVADGIHSALAFFEGDATCYRFWQKMYQATRLTSKEF